MLAWLILIPILGAFLSWWAARWDDRWARVLALFSMVVELGLGLFLWANASSSLQYAGRGNWLKQVDWPWIPALGIRFQLGLDGLSLWMVLLAGVLGIFSIVASWGEIKHRVGFFHFNLLLMLAGIIGVFTALDLFLFYFFWELMLIPTFFLIFIWGDANRRVAGLKFFIFTQLSGLLMLVAIIGLFFVHGRNTGEYTFAYSKLLETAIDNSVARWLMLGFLAAFLVKLPAVPFHTWLPAAYTSAPTAGSILLAGLMSKTAGYA